MSVKNYAVQTVNLSAYIFGTDNFNINTHKIQRKRNKKNLNVHIFANLLPCLWIRFWNGRCFFNIDKKNTSKQLKIIELDVLSVEEVFFFPICFLLAWHADLCVFRRGKYSLSEYFLFLPESLPSAASLSNRSFNWKQINFHSWSRCHIKCNDIDDKIDCERGLSSVMLSYLYFQFRCHTKGERDLTAFRVHHDNNILCIFTISHIFSVFIDIHTFRNMLLG